VPYLLWLKGAWAAATPVTGPVTPWGCEGSRLPAGHLLPLFNSQAGGLDAASVELAVADRWSEGFVSPKGCTYNAIANQWPVTGDSPVTGWVPGSGAWWWYGTVL